MINISVDENNLWYSNDEFGVLFNKDKTILIQYPLANVIKSYTVPDSVLEISDYSFEGCRKIEGVEISHGVKNIGESAFEDCWWLESVNLPDSIINIGENAFSGCEYLSKIFIPSSVTYIGEYAFSSCRHLESIEVDSNNLYYCSDEYGVLFNKDKTELIYYPVYSDASIYIIPTNVSVIHAGAFHYANNINSIKIPRSVTFIDYSAFDYCYNLSNIYYLGTEQEWNDIEIKPNNNYLLNATIHYNS